MDNQKKIDRYYAASNTRQNFLDFGCGSDNFLNQIAKKGWRTTGMDFNTQAINAVLASGHAGVVYDSEQAWDKLPDNGFDFIRMNHVLEHLYHPKTVLNALYKKLKPGGILHIAVPNPLGLSAQEFKSSWLGLDCPRHVIFYPSEILARLLKDIGFSSQELVFEDVQKDYVRSLGFVKYKQGLLEHKYIEGLMYNKDLMRRYAVKFKIAALQKKSDRFHIFAHK
jgi:SAM-dependent methyltransferase